MNIGARIKTVMQKVPGVMSVTLNSEAGKRELTFTPKRKAIAQDGLTVQTVAASLRTAVAGMVATKYRENGDEFDVKVMLDPSDTATIEDIRNIPVPTQKGIQPLSRYADVHWESGFSMIMRQDKERTIQLDVELLPGYATSKVQTAITTAIAAQVKLPAGYHQLAAGMTKGMAESFGSMLQAVVIAILLTFMLLCVILESFKQPLFILSTVPLSMIGIALAVFVCHTVLNTIAMIGIIMLISIVVNNAILMLDYYNQLRRDEGLGQKEALYKACPAKLRAILMSNISIILGMIPMAMGIGASMAEMRAPMGIVMIGGVISATVLTLWFIPALELVFTRHKGERQA
jgi:HAE1 family hydrophobic/amphiphilic exporter-1